MAYRALIVDDEPIIRYGLISTVDWSSAGVEMAGEAGNGETALGLVEERSIDILITDIKMPRMDGLELIRLSKQIRPHLKAILISSYSDFDYAREAVRLGVVVDYLLKPTMEPEDVTRLLSVCCSKLKEESSVREQAVFDEQEGRNRSRQELETQMQRCLNGQPANLMKYAKEWQGPFRLCVWRLEGGPLPAGSDNCHMERLSALLPEGLVCKSGEREWSVLLKERSVDGLSAVRLTRQVHAAITADSADGGSDRSVFTVGLSPSFHGLERMKDAYQWAENAFATAFFEGAGRCYEGEIRRTEPGEAVSHRVVSQDNDSGLAQIREQAAALRETFSRKLAESQESACEQTLGQLCELWKSRVLPPPEIRKQAGDVLLRMQSVLPYLRAEEKLELLMGDYEKLRLANTLEEVAALVIGRFRQGQLLGEVFPVSSPRDEPFGAHAIQSAVAYIQDHYRTEISLREVADSIHMSRNYFSEQFKRRTGLNFIDYVIRLRIRYARHLLETTTLKVYDIGSHCGFHSSKHFLKMFKRETGCTPAEYRSRSQQKEGEES